MLDEGLVELTISKEISLRELAVILGVKEFKIISTKRRFGIL
jgi:hypothetical protein